MHSLPRNELPPRRTLTFLCRADGQPWRVLLDGEERRFSPLQLALLVLLARAGEEAVHRDDLLQALHVDSTGLYKAVHTVRRRLGDARHVEHVGACFSREGRSRGFAGYRLAALRVEWLVRAAD